MAEDTSSISQCAVLLALLQRPDAHRGLAAPRRRPTAPAAPWYVPRPRPPATMAIIVAAAAAYGAHPSHDTDPGIKASASRSR